MANFYECRHCNERYVSSEMFNLSKMVCIQCQREHTRHLEDCIHLLVNALNCKSELDDTTRRIFTEQAQELLKKDI
jgi:hypothetical protein